MPKTKEELDTIKKEYQDLASKLKELSEDEIKEVTGGEIDIEIHTNWEVLPTMNSSKK